MGAKMHVDEVDIDARLVGRLIATQFPAWADLPLRAIRSAGTVNAIYRLGDEMSVQLPRVASWAHEPERDHRWLRRFAPLLPLAAPLQLAVGEPAEGYPLRWSVHRWLPGEDASRVPFADEHAAAVTLAGFITALHGLDAADWPATGPPRSTRGVSLASRDAATRAWIATPPSPFDIHQVTAAWEADLAAPDWPGPLVWIHGDIQPLSVLVDGGRISAVIDFEAIGVGDPATDVMAAWSLFSRDGRATFRAALGVDDVTWARSRGWALSVWVAVLPYYAQSNPDFSAIARRAIAEILADHRAGSSASVVQLGRSR